MAINILTYSLKSSALLTLFNAHPFIGALMLKAFAKQSLQPAFQKSAAGRVLGTIDYIIGVPALFLLDLLTGFESRQIRKRMEKHAEWVKRTSEL